MSTANVSLQMLHRIVLDAASAHTVEEQVERLVAQVCEALDVAVCSLYQRLDDDSLLLVANRGLRRNVVQRISLRPGEGLVGLVAAERMLVLQSDASAHPAFRHFPESGESAYPSFLGVPIVHLGGVNGVLVVQDRAGREFSDDEQSFLVTIAAQLGPVLLRLTNPSAPPGVDREVQGISAAGGKAIGFIHLVISDETLQLVDEPDSLGAEAELGVLARAVSQVAGDIDAAQQKLRGSVSAEVLDVFDFYKLMLSGDQLVSSAEQRIRSGASAFAAVRGSVDELVHAFDAIDDEYLRVRGEDIRHVGNRLLSSILGASLAPLPAEDEVVLLGAMVGISDIGLYRPEQLAGIVCFKGSALSHTAMLARSLGIPAVVGTGPVDHIHEGMQAVVDGDAGRLVLAPSPSTLEVYQSLMAEEGALQRDLLAQKDLPAVTSDGVRITLLANTGLLADAEPGKLRGAEGIGLYRSEIPFIAASSLPSEAEQTGIYRQILASYHPLPVTMRTLDVGGDKQLPYLSVDEENPALGWRGIRFALDNRVIFTTQMRAMLRANEGLGNLNVLLPMIGDVREVEEADGLLRGLVSELQGEGLDVTRPRLGIMIEVPAVVGLLPRIAPLIDFASIGTNDLTQYLLAIDRGNSRVAARYDHLHPAVLQTLADIEKANRRLALDIAVCGEMAADPLGVAVLVGLGFRTLSMNAFSLPKVRALVRALSVAKAARLARKAARQPDAAKVRALIAGSLTRQGLGAFL